MNLSLMTIMTNIFAPLCIEYGATKHVGKTIFRFSGFTNENRIDSENNKKFLKATLCHQIYKEISGCPEDVDQGDPVLLRARLSAFTRGKKSKHTLSPKELVSLATNEPTALFLSELNRIEELIDVTAYIECVGISQVDENITLEAQLGSCPEEQLLLYKEQVKKELADQYNRNIKQFECPDFFKLEATNCNITLILTCLILHAVFNNEAFLEQLDSKEKEKIKKNIEDFFVLHSDNKPDYKRAYYEKLWKNHYKGIVRDQVATGNVRELIDFFVIPTITNEENEKVSIPFSGVRYSKFLTAGSGFGKSTLLDIILLCNVIDNLDTDGTTVLSDNSKKKIGEYKKIKESLFGDSSTCMFPVFIHSNQANNMSYASALELAEASDTENFEKLVADANNAEKLLFLIDSIDEVEADKIDSFLNAINLLLEKYPNASTIFASRFFGKRVFPFQFETLHLVALEMEDVEKIASSILSKSVSDKLIGQIKKNTYLYSLAKNPFMLMTILEIKGDNQLHHLLQSIVNAIIDRRWEKHTYDMSSEDIKLLLGFLATKFIFDGRKQADISAIRQSFFKAESVLNLNGVSFDVPKKNIEYFLKTLSSQSGILNVVNDRHVEKYEFQDSLVKCWLAANYIYRILSETEEVHDRDGIAGVWSNVNWLDKFIRANSQKEIALSEEAVDALVLILVMSSETLGLDIQKSILYYLIFKDATSLNEREKMAIHKGYKNIMNNIFGLNDITNHEDSDSLKLIKNML